MSPVAIPAHSLNTSADLDKLMQQIGDARIVMLGEASHGTHEFYTWRSAISQRLIAEKGFDMIAVEGEWAYSYRVNQFVQGGAKDSRESLAVVQHYDRWPTWMWGNRETADLIGWMNHYNQQQAPGKKAGFYGLDLYCLWESMQELMPYVQHNEKLRLLASQVDLCFRPFSADPIQYAYAVARADVNCRIHTETLYQSVLLQTGNSPILSEAQFVAQQNALVALNGERYYRAVTTSYPDSWNIRDRHMEQTLERLLDWKGPDAKIIVWAHNTHVGDARYTDMAAGGMVNLGQLAREHFGEQEVYIVGFGTYAGEVIASNSWGGRIQTMRVPPAQSDSWEAMLHSESATNKLVFSKQLADSGLLQNAVAHRAIGVQYNPDREWGNYVPSVIPRRYDAFVYIDHTTALQHLGTPARNEPPETYPTGY